MDKKNFTIGAVLLLAAFAVLILGPKSPPPTKSPASPAVGASANPATAPNTANTASATPSAAGGAASATAAPARAIGVINRDPANATVTTLANEFIEARFTDFGGAIREVAFKQYPEVQGEPAPYVFNHLHEDPILALNEFPGLGSTTQYQRISATATEVVYRAVLDGRIEVTRTYRLTDPAQAGGDPYRLHHETVFRNLTDATVPLPRATLTLGTAALLNARDYGQHLNVASYDGEDTKYIELGQFAGGGIGSWFGSGRPPTNVIEQPGNVVWAVVKNQTFASIYTPEKPAIGLVAHKIDLTTVAPFPDPSRPNTAVSGAARFELPALAAQGTAKLAGSLYVGAQEYRRLAKFEQREDRVLPYRQYFFNRIFLSGYVAPLLNTLLNTAHRWVGNWGIAIVIMTLVLKIVSLPFTLAASRSAKRMAKLQPELQAIREKFKDNPQKQQLATMELFKTHKVNPVGGCIPVLITFPLFIGFFAMLQSVPELRFAPFLWAKDLSAPDTIGHLFGVAWLPINIMPLLMGGTMVYQMHLTPTPSTDNMQVKMMKFMPIVFTLFCYNFSCALALYSTINGLFTIVQQLIVNRSKDTDPVPAAKSVGGKPLKNVTPREKKLKD